MEIHNFNLQNLPQHFVDTINTEYQTALLVEEEIQYITTEDIGSGDYLLLVMSLLILLVYLLFMITMFIMDIFMLG